MFVKLKNGPRAGEIVEMKFTDARELLLDGRADPAYPDEIAVASADKSLAAQKKPPADAPPAVKNDKKNKKK
jgi:hypothetical protein